MKREKKTKREKKGSENQTASTQNSWNEKAESLKWKVSASEPNVERTLALILWDEKNSEMRKARGAMQMWVSYSLTLLTCQISCFLQFTSCLFIIALLRCLHSLAVMRVHPGTFNSLSYNQRRERLFNLLSCQSLIFGFCFSKMNI